MGILLFGLVDFLISSLRTDGPAFSLAPRMKAEKVYVTPAPSTYDMRKPEVVRVRAPAYSLAGRFLSFCCVSGKVKRRNKDLYHRFSLPGDKATLPGPGAYIPEKVCKTCLTLFSKLYQYAMNCPHPNSLFDAGEHKNPPARVQFRS